MKHVFAGMIERRIPCCFAMFLTKPGNPRVFGNRLRRRHQQDMQSAGLLIGSAVMTQPAARMPALRIAMSPVNDTTLPVGLKFAEKGDAISLAKPGNPRRDVDVVGNQQRAAARKLQYESLVPAALVVVREDTYHRSGPLGLATINQRACTGLRWRRNVGRGRNRLRERLLRRAVQSLVQVASSEQNQYGNKSFHLRDATAAAARPP